MYFGVGQVTSPSTRRHGRGPDTIRDVMRRSLPRQNLDKRPRATVDNRSDRRRGEVETEQCAHQRMPRLQPRVPPQQHHEETKQQHGRHRADQVIHHLLSIPEGRPFGESGTPVTCRSPRVRPLEIADVIGTRRLTAQPARPRVTLPTHALIPLDGRAAVAMPAAEGDRTDSQLVRSHLPSTSPEGLLPHVRAAHPGKGQVRSKTIPATQ